MLLKNFGALLSTAMGDTNLKGDIKCTTGEFPKDSRLLLIPSASTIMTSTVRSTNYTQNTAGSGNPSWTIGYGDGTTPPTIDDYKFSGELVTPSLVSGSGIISSGSNGATFQVVVSNSTVNTMTINEIGLFAEASSSSVMLTHDVLPEPVVLEPGASKGFQIYIDTQSFISNAAQA